MTCLVVAWAGGCSLYPPVDGIPGSEMAIRIFWTCCLVTFTIDMINKKQAWIGTKHESDHLLQVLREEKTCTAVRETAHSSGAVGETTWITLLVSLGSLARIKTVHKQEEKCNEFIEGTRFTMVPDGSGAAGDSTSITMVGMTRI